MKSKKYTYLNGFSLVEMAMVLLVIGIIVGSVFKGKDVIESAQIRSVANDIECIIMSYNNYVGTYGCLPGDDSKASTKFPNVSNGDGDGKYSTEDAEKIFSHLHGARLISSTNFKTPKIGGVYSFIFEKDTLKLQIASADKKGILTAKQVILLRAKLIEILGDEGGMIETDSNLLEDEKKYIVKIPIK